MVITTNFVIKWLTNEAKQLTIGLWLLRDRLQSEHKCNKKCDICRLYSDPNLKRTFFEINFQTLILNLWQMFYHSKICWLMNVPFDFGGHFAQNEKVTNFPMNSRIKMMYVFRTFHTTFYLWRKIVIAAMNKKKLSKQVKLSPILKMEKSMKFTCTILFRSLVATKSSTFLKIN